MKSMVEMKSKNVALVLSSGGARGIAHVGVIEELEARGYTITAVSGTSMGAVIGGFYAAGKLQDYMEWISDLDRFNVFNLIDFSFSTLGMMKGKKVFQKMSEWMEDITFDDLNIPFSCVASDLVHRKEVVFDEGDVMQAIRASVAIPGYIEPQVIGDRYLYDGGIVNPIPINRVKRNDGDLVVAVDLNTYQPDFDPETYFEDHDAEESPTLKRITDVWFSAIKNIELLHHGASEAENVEKVEPTKEKHLSQIGALTEMFDMMQENVTKQSIATEHPDVLIEIPRNLCSTFEFHRSKELVAFGRERAAEALDKLEKSL